MRSAAADKCPPDLAPPQLLIVAACCEPKPKPGRSWARAEAEAGPEPKPKPKPKLKREPCCEPQLLRKVPPHP